MVDIATGMQTAADTSSLGTPVAEYKPRSRRKVLNLIAGFILSVAGGFAILYGAISVNVPTDDRPPVMILGGILLLIGWAMIESWLQTRGLSVQVFTDGLVRSQYGKSAIMRWDEIVGVWQAITKHYYNGIYTGTTHTYTVQKADGTKTKYNDSLKNVEELGNTIQQEVTKRLLPRAVATYNSGGTVSFGKLAISPMGLAWGDKSLPWADIQGVQINKGMLSVKKQGKWLNWANIPVASIPNMLVALTLIDRIIGINAKK